MQRQVLKIFTLLKLINKKTNIKNLYKELGKYSLRLFNKNIASSILIRGTSCPVNYGLNGRGIPDRAKVA